VECSQIHSAARTRYNFVYEDSQSDLFVRAVGESPWKVIRWNLTVSRRTAATIRAVEQLS
jgi:hypothetical protein